MYSRRTKNFRNNFDRTLLDKQVDKIFETGRQFVEGVSGTRPGNKRNSEFSGISRRNVKNVGKWVTDKMDLLLEEERDDWSDKKNIYEDPSENKSFIKGSRFNENAKTFSKRPLEALSLRQSKNIQQEEQKKLPYGKTNISDEWPDDSDLKVDRWQRSSDKTHDTNINIVNPKSGLTKGRSLPRSRRRRI